MNVCKNFVTFSVFFVLVSFASNIGYAQTCPAPVRLAHDNSDHATIQLAYDYASFDLSLTDFTLLLASATIEEDLILAGGTVLLDGGYDCTTFSTKTSVTNILGSITISSTGSAVFADIGITSPAACAFDTDGDGFTSIGSCSGSADDCDDNNSNTYPGAPEVCDGADNNCDGQADEGLTVVDADGDGYTDIGSCGGSADDCNDSDPNINPDAAEILGDGIDQDCDGQDLVTSFEYDCFNISCHGGVEAINNLMHQSVAVPDNSCTDCHAAKVSGVLPGHYGETIRTADNNMNAGETIICTSCHDYHDPAAYDIGSANLNALWPKVKATNVGPPTYAYVNLTCDTCHDNRAAEHSNAHSVEVGPDDLSYDPPGRLCSDCHVVSNWAEIEETEHNVVTNGPTSCSTCHSSPRVEVQITITSGIPPIHCLDCHSDKDLTPHGNVDHVAPGYVTGGTTSCLECHDPGTGANGTVSVIHNDNCALCHTTVPELQTGVPAGGGDCITCHGDYFPNHSHHNGTSNDVSYNAQVDTSQSSQQGCVVCHHDYDTFNSTSLGLSTWQTILVEHDLDGTKDGSTNSCDNCHAYDGSATAPLTAVQNAIASGNPATCATCHTDKVPDVDHGVPTSGKHTEHLALTGISCSTCHGNIPYFKSGTDINGDGLYTLDETDVCDTCHQDATGNPVTGFKTGWSDPDYTIDCSSCHAVAPATGSHDTHLVYTDCANCHADAISGTIAPAEHLDNNIDVYDVTPGDLGYPSDKVIGSTESSCSTSYCHSTAQGVNNPTDPPVYAVSPVWGSLYGSTEATCTGCHDSGGHVGDANSVLATGSHARHLEFRYDQDATCNACHFDWEYTGCTSCHQRQVKHVDNSIDVVFKPNFPLSASSSSGSYSGDPAPRTAYGSCSALYCHSPGTKASAPYDAPNVVDINWGGSSMPADCSGCHNGDTAAVQPMATGSHGTHIANYDCSRCHSRTVDNSRALNSTIYAPKNYTYGQRYHVDGWITVAFSSDIATIGTYAGSASPTLYRAPGLAAGACANTYCHSDGTSVSSTVIPNNTSPVWGTVDAVSCGSCHSSPPAYDSGTPKANSHAAHSGYSCDTCHFSTTTTGNTITNAAKHADQEYDVQSGSGVTFAYTYDSNGGTCSNISCHGDATWGQTVTHSVEVGPNDLSYNAPGQLCSSCHVVAGWAEIEGIEHNVDTNGPGSCATCHNSPRQEVIDAIALGANPTHCLDCHSDKELTLHGSIDHVAAGYVALLVNPCGDCHDPGSAENATVDVTHNGNCSLCHTTVPNLQPDVPVGGGDCDACHGSDVQTVHASCTTCHGEPPNGTSAPNTEAAHNDHAALGYGSVSPNCNACHDSATHYNGTTDVSILSSFDDESWGSPSFNGTTCSSTRCHGGQTTPDWETGSIDVNTQCTSCHDQRDRGDIPNQYNDYYSGEHDKHVRGADIGCLECHNTTKLASGHFSNLETTTFEQDPASTIGGGTTSVPDDYSGTCTLNCHGEYHWNENWQDGGWSH